MTENITPDPGMNWFINELNARAITMDQIEMRAWLIVHHRVRNILADFEKEGVQIITPDYGRQAEPSEGYQRNKSSMADFVIRKNNVELQLEIKLVIGNIMLSPEDYQRYFHFLSSNPNTKEILITLNDENLSTLSLSLDKIQERLNIKESTSVNIRSLPNLKQSINEALAKYRPIWFKTTEFDLQKPPRYDFGEIFNEALRQNIGKYIKTAGKRRHRDREQALKSMSTNDIRLLERIFNESKTKSLNTDDIEKILQDYISRT